MNWRRFFRRDTDEYIAPGMDRNSTRDAARRKLGNATLIREEVYEMNTLAFLESLLGDGRHALRMIRLNPGFSAAAILSLALGIGGSVATFSVVNAVLIRPLPYPEPESLVGVFNSGVSQGEIFNDMGLGPGMYAGLKEHSTAFQEFGVWSSGTATVTGTGDPERINTVRMTQGILPALAAQPFRGRRFSIADDSPGTPQTVILSYSYWLRRFGGDERVLGREVVSDSVPCRVIGVMPQTFRFLDLSPDVLLPQRFATANLPFEPFPYSGIARLKSGITIDLANQDSARVLQQIIPENIRPFAEQAQLRPNLRPLKRVRARARTQEFAIRAALGAGWGRIARELSVERLTLGLVGGACGLVLAYGAVQILKAQDLTSIPRLAEVSIDAATVAFGLACSVAGGLLFGRIAVFRCGIPGKLLNARGASMGLDQLRARNVLVVAQVALALVLLVASGLLIRSFVALHGVRPGFTQPERIQTIRINIPETQVPEPERAARMQAEIIETVARLPGVEAAAFADALPMEADSRNGMIVAVEGKFEPGRIPPNRDVKHVSPRLFATQGTRLLAGREFTREDLARHRRVAIVSESMARENWGPPDAALGKRLRPGALGDIRLEVVPVVEDVHDVGAHKPAPPIVYFRMGVHDPWRPGR